MSSYEVVLVTGANTGLGFQTVRALCSSENAYIIIIGCRSLAKAQEAVNAAVGEFPSSHSKLCPVQVDIEDDGSIQKAFEKVQSEFSRVDVLINNAGVQPDQQLTAGKMTMREMWNQSWNVHVTGTNIMTHTFIPLLIDSPKPRLLFITGGTSTHEGIENMSLFVNYQPPKGWPKKELGGVYAYRSSKTGLNMMMREWYKVLKEDGVRIWCISPGYLATGLGSGLETNLKQGATDPAEGGKLVRSVVEGKRDGDTGRVVLRSGVQSW